MQMQAPLEQPPAPALPLTPPWRRKSWPPGSCGPQRGSMRLPSVAVLEFPQRRLKWQPLLRDTLSSKAFPR